MDSRSETVQSLIGMLLDDMPEYRAEASRVPSDALQQRKLLRSLMNLRRPLPLSDAYCRLQDALLGAEREEKGVVQAGSLPCTALDGRMALWQGDITRLAADAVVNAANSALLGCFCPCHGCIDNAIHSAAGLQLRNECNELMIRKGREAEALDRGMRRSGCQYEEGTGLAELTSGYNLPARYVIHTVGPVIRYADSSGRPCVTDSDRVLLASCYKHSLELAAAHCTGGEPDIHSIAFCCISTGEFRFPNEEAAQIAVSTARSFLDRTGSSMKVIFNVFKDADYEIYRRLLG